MIMTEKSKQHIDACRFCWMCHHICPIGNATGLERNTPKARALGLSLVTREALAVTDVADSLYECACCGGCVHDCITGWDPVMFTKEARLQAALDGALPEYINVLVENVLETGNAYGKTELDGQLRAEMEKHSAKTDTLLFLGVDARYQVPEAAIKAIRVLEKANLAFTILADEPASGQQLEYLISAAGETKEQMNACAKTLNEYKHIVAYDPQDAKMFKREYKEWGVELDAQVETFTAFLARLVEEGALKLKNTNRVVTYQDPFQLSRDLGETEAARKVITACAELKEMLCHGAETLWAGNLLMQQWLKNVILEVAKCRIQNAKGVAAKVIVTASVSEYAALKAAAQDEVEILSMEDLILES